MDLEYIANLLANLSGVPARVYINKQLQYFSSLIELYKDPANLYIEEILSKEDNVSYFTTHDFLTYGVVKSKDIAIVIGPSRPINMNDQDLKSLAFQLDIPVNKTNDFISGMKRLGVLPLDSMLQILFSFSHLLNGDKLTLKDIKIHEDKQVDIKIKIQKETANKDLEEISNDYINNSYAIEEKVMGMVIKGDINSLRAWMSNAPSTTSGILANEQIRQSKNTFVVTATLACRNAIRGGMEINDALILSDSYIQKCELLNNIDDINNLQFSMIIDYTERVARIRHSSSQSQLAIDVTNYILHHLSEPIKTEDIANKLYLSRSRLSTKFKQETGETLKDYILKEKCKEGERLLKYSDKSILSIAYYLGFSSPAHFSRVFKKYIGVTPKEYK